MKVLISMLAYCPLVLLDLVSKRRTVLGMLQIHPAPLHQVQQPVVSLARIFVLQQIGEEG